MKLTSKRDVCIFSVCFHQIIKKKRHEIHGGELSSFSISICFVVIFFVFLLFIVLDFHHTIILIFTAKHNISIP